MLINLAVLVVILLQVPVFHLLQEERHINVLINLAVLVQKYIMLPVLIEEEETPGPFLLSRTIVLGLILILQIDPDLLQEEIDPEIIMFPVQIEGETLVSLQVKHY